MVKTSDVKKLYETAPFPNIQIKSDSELLLIGRNFCKGLGFNPKDIENKRVLVAGCGTGEHVLGIALAFKPKEIIGIDLSNPSLKIANQRKKEFKITNVKFLNIDIFSLSFANESFDYVISEGVLHHTINPKKAFESLSKLVKKDGILIIGMYSMTGRFVCRLKRAFVHFFGRTDADKIKFGSFFYKGKPNKARLYDSYLNPIIEYYWIGDMLSLYENNGFRYIGSYYPFEISRTLDTIIHKIQKKTYKQQNSLKHKPSFFDRFFIQLIWLFTQQFMIRMAGKKIKIN